MNVLRTSSLTLVAAVSFLVGCLSDSSVSESHTAVQPDQATDQANSALWVVTGNPSVAYSLDDELKVRQEVDLPQAPKNMVIVDDQLWQVRDWSDRLHYTSLATGESGSIGFTKDSFIVDLAFGAGLLWVGDGRGGAIWQVNPETRAIVGGVQFDDRSGMVDNAYHLAFDPARSRLWVSKLFGRVGLLGFDAYTLERTGEAFGGDGVTGLTVGADSVWTVARFDGSLRRFEPDTVALGETVELGVDLSAMSQNVAVSHGKVWVAAGGGGNFDFAQDVRPGVIVVDANTSEVLATIDTGTPSSVRAGKGFVWVAVAERGVLQIDPETYEVVATFVPPRGQVLDIAFAQTGGGQGLASGLAAVNVDDIVPPPPDTACDFGVIGHGTSFMPTLSGNATMTVNGEDVQLEGVRCELLYDEEGQPARYAASFSDLSESRRNVTYDLYAYNGAGTYTEGTLNWDGEDPVGGLLGLWVANVSSAELGERGRTGYIHAASDEYDLHLKYDCGSTSALENPTWPSPNLEPGQARIIDQEGIVYLIEGIGCAANPVTDELRVRSEFVDPGFLDVGQPFFSMTVSNSIEGQHSAELFYNYYNLRGARGKELTVNITCDADGEGGTFSGRPDYDYLRGITGAFRCP